MNKPQISYLPQWLRWAREIQAIAQTGQHYALNDFQRMRYSRLHEIAAEIISVHSSLSFDFVQSELKSRTGYATPKVDVRGAIFQRDKILLVKELVDNCWTMPGGWADVGESPKDSVEREVFEESGLVVRAIKLVGVYDANQSSELPPELFHAYKIIFLCEIIGGEIVSSNETLEADFFGFSEIPRELSLKRTEMRHIENSFAASTGLGYMPVFD